MDWFKMYAAKVRDPSFMAAKLFERGVWLNVVCYCVEQENGGRIVGAAHWKDRQWQQTCGLSTREVNQSINLLTWDGNDLIVWNYPKDSEMEVKAKRIGGRLGNEKRWKSQAKIEVTSESLSDSLDAAVNPSHTDSVSESREEERRTEKKSPPSPQGVEGDEEIIDQIYNAYPRKTKDRRKAFDAIRIALKKADAATLRAAVLRYAKTPGLDRENGRYIPAPAKWFSDECWKDYLAKPVAPLAAILRPTKPLEDLRVMFACNRSPEETRALTITYIEMMTPDDFGFLTEEEWTRIGGICPDALRFKQKKAA